MKLHSIKHLGWLLGFLAAAASTGAQAADLGSTKDIGYAAVDMPEQWAGFYAGAGITGVFSGAHVASGASGPRLNLSADASPGGDLTLGYNWQFGRWVVGAEGNLAFSETNHTGTDAVLGSVNVQRYDYGSLQVRGGYTFGNALLYGTTGLEFTAATVSGSTLANGQNEKFLNLFLGAGVEYALDRQWSLRTELKYYGVGGNTNIDFTSGNREIDEGYAVFRLGVDRKF